ncbi:hypothetical protein ETB97_007922 [Aspergillus alliaceus]|uniref:Uncharacterized protein n=2 Tax=Petromyces alliaceus TaxID=209559 RepID=A0A8H6EB29_PETAA|nr:hypothetical protein ETB97_007922 [Aspergillus burnettii]
MENQDRDNSNTIYSAQQTHPARPAVLLNPHVQIASDNGHFAKPASQTGGLRGVLEEEDMTASHLDQDKWSLENLPDILYVLKPAHARSRHVVRTTAHKVFGKHINVFTVLPDQISSKVEGWRLEAWMRLDRRITVQDIIDRVNPNYRPRLTPLDIELRRKDFREKFHVACWGAQKSVNEIYRLAASKGIDPALNTTRGLTPGLIDPSKGEAGGRIPLPPGTTCDSTRIVPGLQDDGSMARSRLCAKSHKTHSPGAVRQLLWNTKHLPTKLSPDVDHFHIANPLLKRQLSHDVMNVDYTATRKRRNKISTQQNVFDFNTYPATLRELASYKGPPVQVFPPETEAEITMSLDDYLRGSQLTFWEHLDVRCENSLSDIKRWSLRSWC